MTFLPVVTREMLVNARRKSTYINRVLTALVGLLAMGWLFVLSAANLSTADQGKALFTTLSVISFIFALVVGVGATSDSLSEEKREGTLGLLFLTDLRGYDVVAGKLAASALRAFYTIIGILPMLALALLLGGIAIEQIAAASLILLNTIFFSLSVGALVSSLSKNERKAMFATVCLLFLFAAGPFVMAFAFPIGIFGLGFPSSYSLSMLPLSQILQWLGLCLSPIFPLCVLHDSSSTSGLSAILFIALGMENLLAWACLVAASLILPRVAHDRPAAGRIKTLNQIAERWTYGAGNKRRRFRGKLLDRNPFSWLAGRERIKPVYAWGTLVFFVLLWIWINFQFQEIALDLSVTVALLALVQVVLKIWTASEVSSRMLEDRKSGALELLLSTPLSVKEIARGQSLALRRVFLGPVIVIVGLELFFMTALGKRWGQSSVLVKSVFFASIASFLIDLWAIKWVCMWRSLFARSMERVLIWALASILVLPWVLFGLTVAMGSVIAQAVGSRFGLEDYQTIWIWSGFALAIPLFLAIPARSNFLLHFRELAAHRFDGKQKAFNSVGLFVLGLAARIRRKRLSVTQRISPASKRWIVGVPLGIVLLVLGFCWIRQSYWRGKISRRIAAIHQAGLPVDEPEISKLYPLVAETEDAGPILASATPRLTPRQRGQDNPTAWREELKSNERQLKLLLELPRFSKCNFELRQYNPWTLNSIYSLGSHLKLLRHEALVAIEDKDKTRCNTVLNSLKAFADLMNNQPISYPTNLRLLALEEVTRILEQAWKEGFYSSSDWMEAGVLLAKMSKPNEIKRAIITQRALVLDDYKNNTPTGLYGRLLPALGISNAQRLGYAAIYGLGVRTGSKDKAFVEFLDLFEHFVAIADKPIDERWNSWNQWQNHENISEVAHRSSVFFDINDLTDKTRSALRCDIYYVSLLRSLQIAASIAAGTEYKPLKDPFALSSKEGDLKYRTLTNGFEVYSIGTNQQDDGGDFKDRPWSGRDIGVRFQK